MAVGQGALSAAADVAALDALGLQLAVDELDRGALHARQLRTLLQLQAVDAAAGLTLSTVPNAALVLGASEARAGRLLAEAQLLGSLPGGLEAVGCGLLTVEQSRTVVDHLAPLALPDRLQVWRRLQERFVAAAEARTVLPPARLGELLRRWVIAMEPDDAVARRERAEAARDVDYRLHPTGLGDLHALGLRGPDLLAVLSRIRSRAVPVGPWDDRTAGQRRADALVDLLLGRDPFPQHEERRCAGGPAGGGRAACGCWPGSPVPCGAQLLVTVPLSTALGTSDEPAELVGHGPLEPDLLRELLLAAPRLRAVWTDEHGVPVAVGSRTSTPARDDPAAVRRALLDLAAQPPPEQLHPRHPHDHPEPAAAGGPEPPPPLVPDVPVPNSRAHPRGQPGPYRLPRALRRLLEVRSPRCEWPGCGARAVRCDAEHDLAWPQGPTCACNLGPCCRRHHRVKQSGWTKTRHASSVVTWTSSGGRSWRSLDQHDPPAAPVRPVPPLPSPHPWAELSPMELEHELWSLGLLPDDAEAFELRTSESPEVDGRDVLGEHLTHDDTRWTVDLDDPYRW